MSMPIITHTQRIQAPIEICFDLARNVEVHTETTAKTQERAVGGVTEGLMELGDTVTWEATHLGIRQKLTSRIIQMEKYSIFVDVMVKGAFASFTHTHLFEEDQNATVMTDIFEYTSPFGPVGRVADRLFLEAYMTNFISSRAEELARIAESFE